MAAATTTTRRRIALPLVAALYAVGALLVGFWPTPVDRPLDGQLDAVLASLHANGLPLWLDYAWVEFTANVAFFVPIGLLLCLLLPHRRWFLAIVIGVLGSCLIELGQLLYRPARVASWNDIGANSLGAVIGVAIVLLVRGIRHARRRAG